MDILQSSPHQGSPDRALCVGEFLDSMSAVVTVVGMVVGMLLILSLERHPQELPRATGDWSRQVVHRVPDSDSLLLPLPV